MTNEEALNVARQSLAAFEFVPEAYDSAYTEACAAALEKQIPKKPRNVIGFYICPVCGQVVENVYCDNCGQKLDWRERFAEPELEIVDFAAEDVVTASAEDMDDDRPGHGYGDKNHEHKHWKDGV